ncbi:30S ribosomal protein S2 [Pseudomonadota bacterium]
MTTIDIKDMLEAAVHFGHKTQKWNPKMRPYIFGVKNNIHIFDLQKSMDSLKKALEYVRQLSAEGKTILLVSTKQQAAALIVEVAKETKMPYVINKWMPGLLTNFSTMKRRIKYLNDLIEQEKTGELEKYTKKEASDFKKDITKLEVALGGVKTVRKLPDALFVADIVRDDTTVKEANKLGIPVIGITDTNADPDTVTYPIPGNDDAIKSLTYLITAVKDAILEGRKSKKD